MSRATDLYCQEITNITNRTIYSTVVFDGRVYSADANSRSVLSGWVSHIAAGGTLPSDFVWRDVDNQDIPMTTDKIIGLNAAMLQLATVTRVHSWATKAEICAATDHDSAIDTIAEFSNNPS